MVSFCEVREMRRAEAALSIIRVLSDVVTGERPEIERLMGSFGEGWLEKLCQLGGRSLATYSTACTVLKPL